MRLKILSISAVLWASSCPSKSASVNLAWDASPSIVTEYLVHYGTSTGVRTASESAGLSLSKTISGLPDGFRYYFAVTAKGPEGESLPSNEVNFRKPSTNPIVRIIIQAESAILDLPFVSTNDATAMGGQFSATTNIDSGACRFVFTVPFVDEFSVWSRVLSPNEGQDSFYVSDRNHTEDIYDTVHVTTNTWQWTEVNGRGGLDKPVESSHAISPRMFIMSGTNEIRFRGREKWTGLDAILITNDRNLVPKSPTAPLNLLLNGER